MNQHADQTILVVDDEASIRFMLEKRLARWNYRVMTAENGRKAIACIQPAPPDLVITDLYMPDGDGFELLRYILELPAVMPVIVISGQGQLEDAIQALRLGAWDYLYKPIEEASLLRMTIERALEKAQLLKENQIYRDHLEDLVAAKNAELIEKAASLEKANEALKNLLEQRGIEKKAIEQTMVANLKRYVFPYLDDLEDRKISNDTRTHLNIIRTNIEQLISPVTNGLGGAYLQFTPTEIKVADLIRQGQSTKTIAATLNTSPSTVEKHRNKIRKKLNILHSSINLHTYLNSLT